MELFFDGCVQDAGLKRVGESGVGLTQVVGEEKSFDEECYEGDALREVSECLKVLHI